MQPRKCFNCNQPGHLANQWPKREPGSCFICGRHGHKADTCRQTTQIKAEAASQVVNQGNATHCIGNGNSFIPAKTTEAQILLDNYHSPLMHIRFG